jgi:hypothetical protein
MFFAPPSAWQLAPAAGTHRSIGGKDDGVVDPPSDLMDLRSVNLGAEKISLQVLYPP